MAGEKSMTGVTACRKYILNSSELVFEGYKQGTMEIKPVERLRKLPRSYAGPWSRFYRFFLRQCRNLLFFLSSSYPKYNTGNR